MTVAGPLIALMGPTGAGKSVQAQILANERGWVYISPGYLLRHSPEPQLRAIVRSGQLAPSSSVQELLQAAIEERATDLTIVIDGFPRLIDEAHWLDKLLRRLGRDVGRVVVLEIDPVESQQRLALRGRADDAPAALARKWEEYRQGTQAVLDHYRERGLLIEIDGRGTVEQVAAAISQALIG